MGKILLGSVEAHEKLTAKLYWKEDGQVGYWPCGNVIDFKYNPTNEYRTRMASAKGWRYVDDEQLDSTHQKWEFTLDEEDENNARLLRLATPGVVTTQALDSTNTVSFVGVTKGQSYFLGARPVYAVVVEVSSVAKTLNTDYTLDARTGEIYIIPGGSIANGATIDVDYGKQARSYENWTMRDAVLFRGAIKILEYNQHDTEPLRETDFTGIIRASAWPEQTGEFGKFVVTATATTQPTVKKRYESVDSDEVGS